MGFWRSLNCHRVCSGQGVRGGRGSGKPRRVEPKHGRSKFDSRQHGNAYSSDSACRFHRCESTVARIRQDSPGTSGSPSFAAARYAAGFSHCQSNSPISVAYVDATGSHSTAVRHVEIDTVTASMAHGSETGGNGWTHGPIRSAPKAARCSLGGIDLGVEHVACGTAGLQLHRAWHRLCGSQQTVAR